MGYTLINYISQYFSIKIMLQRISYDSDFQSLYQENSILRDRLKKMNEIEPYVEILLENNKKYQIQVNDLQTQNHRLRRRTDQLTEETLRLKEAHSSQIVILKNDFQTDIDKLIKELRQIVRDKDAMQHANQLVIQQLQTKYRRDLENRRLEQQSSERDLSSKISKLSDMLRQNENILQQKIWGFSHKQEEFIRDIQKLSYQKNNLQRQIALFKEQVAVISNQKENLAKKNKELQKDNQQISKKWLKSEQDKSQTILQLKDFNKELVLETQKLTNQVRAQDKNIQEFNRRIVNLTRQCEQVCIKNNDLEANIRRLARAKNDLQSQLKEVRQKLEALSRCSTEDISCQAQQIDKLTDDNKNLLKQNALLNSQCNDKTTQIGDLLQAVEKLEIKLDQTNSKYLNCENQNKKLIAHLKKLEETIDELSLQCKSLNQKVSLYTKHNQTLEKMLEKQKRKNICLETSRYQIENLALGAINKPEEICKQYEREIQKMVQEFILERKLQQQRNITEINKLRSSYEIALKQKQEYFDHKILFLQKELNELRRI